LSRLIPQVDIKIDFIYLVLPQVIEIEYEYISDNLLRKREKPFSIQEQENVIIWIYDNYQVNYTVKNINLQIKFENHLEDLKLKAYPEKLLVVSYSRYN
jgi:hypothetical protein